MLPAMTPRRVLSLSAFVAGALLLAWQVRSTGIGDIARGFRAVGGWGAAGILLLSWLRMVARSTGWTALLSVDTPPGRALAAVIAGDAAGNLTPLSMLVSEPAKAAVLGWAVPTVSTSAALAALAAETFFYGVSVAIYSLLGAAALLYVYDIDPALRTGGVVAAGAMTSASASPPGWRCTNPRSSDPCCRESRSARCAGSRRSSGHSSEPPMRPRRTRARASASSRRPAAMFHVLSFLEMWLTLWLVTGQSLPVAAFILDTVGRLTNAFFKVIPLQLGVLQVGSELVGRAIGLPPGVGVLVSLIRTARVLVWTAVGLVILGRHGTR
jgi:hypothetical protein